MSSNFFIVFFGGCTIKNFHCIQFQFDFFWWTQIDLAPTLPLHANGQIRISQIMHYLRLFLVPLVFILQNGHIKVFDMYLHYFFMWNGHIRVSHIIHYLRLLLVPFSFHFMEIWNMNFFILFFIFWYYLFL